VRLSSIDWKTSSAGNRCGDKGRFGNLNILPGTDLPFNRGAVVVRPQAKQPLTDFFAFSDSELVVDGVSFLSNFHRPRTMIKPFVIGTQCVSNATFLGTADGTSPPTLDPQSYRVTLESLVLEGPPNLTLP
jgi:hypothetical protein